MERYCEYKDSGAQWLGEIPSHWNMQRWRFLLVENKEKNTFCKETVQLQFRYGEIIRKSNQDKDPDVLETISKYTIVSPNDIIINGLNLNYDFISQRVARVQEKGVITSAYISLSPTSIANSRYYTYLLKSMDFRKIFHGMGTGIRLTLSYDELKNQFLPYPLLNEQRAIADYLDTVTAKIDEAIAQQQKMIDLLNERKQIIINQAVTKGLDPNVPMKDSGVDWIGEIPEHWKIFSLKHIATFVNGYAFNSDTFNKGEGRKLPVFRISNIGGEGISFNDIVFVECKSIFDNYLVQKDDLLIAMSGATTGKICKVKNEVGYINQRVGIIRSRYSEWIYYNLENYLFKSYIFFLALGSAQPNVASNKIMSYKICIPSQAERQKIIKYIKGRANVIDNAIMKCRKQIFLLQERKQIIINGVVTGKVKVS